MSTVENSEHAREIIIVRHRGGDHDDAPHGGVWKIAFADFMTAMMCFFLVMWLINAANEQTKAAVASYFNPVRLIDRNASRKGLEDMGDGPRDAGLTADSPEENADKSGQGNDGAASSSQKQDSKAAAKQSDSADQRLFADPYAVLAEIATDTAALQNVSEKGDGGAQAAGPATGASGGTSYRDPFAPDFWSQQMATPLAEASAERAKIDGEPLKSDEKTAETSAPPVKAPQPAAAPAPDQEAPSEGAALAASLPLGELGHDVEVIVNRRSISFRINSEILFGTGQVDLSREGLSVLRRMARVLSDAGYDITVEGHTDSVPVRSNARYPSNWELSSARAGSVVRYLQANGIAKEHLKAVGYADSRPIADNRSPDGRSRNRRVELVVEKPHEDRDKAARSDSRPGAETAAAPESSARP